jgi:hypothetical protein
MERMFNTIIYRVVKFFFTIKSGFMGIAVPVSLSNNINVRG